MESDRGKRFTSPGTGDQREAAAAVFGAEMARNMLDISPSDMSPEDQGDTQALVHGLISAPSVNRANRSYVSFFVNRRWIQSRLLGVAVEQAYHGFMAERRYPIAVVNLSVPHEQVDVNAHPTKSEVRFRGDSQVFRVLQHAVRRTLVSDSPVPEVQSHAGLRPETPSGSRAAEFWPTTPFDRSAAVAANGPPAAPLPSLQGHDDVGREEDTTSTQTSVPKRALPVLRVLGQVQNTYIVAEGPDGVYLIDQHAAHERVVFERVMAEAVASTPQVQSLLEPSLVELDPGQRELVESHGEAVASLGFAIEPFGGGAFLLRGVPGLLGEGDPATALLEVLDLMAEGGGFESWEERAAYSVACHAAIRAGKTMAHDEMTELTRQLEGCDQPNTCPHGRPTMIHLTTSQLEREFGRR
jgi:DNA mismatch repair protein MutL